MQRKCRFLKHVITFLFMICGFLNTYALTPSEKTGLHNITQWAIEQQAELQKAQLNLTDLGNENQTLHLANLQLAKDLESKTKEAGENARERDVVIVVAAVFIALYFGSLLAGIPLREFPIPWSMVAAAAIYLGIFCAAYAAGRVFLHGLAQLIP